MNSRTNRKLKALIVEKFGTQAEASVKFGMDEYRLSRIINRRKQPSPEEKRKIAWKLQRRINEIFPEEVGRGN